MGPAAAALLRGLGAKLGGKAGMAIDAYMQMSAYKEVFSQLKSDAISAFNFIGGKWIEMQDIAFQTGRSMAMSREMAMRYDRQLMQTTKELARQYGITAKEIADFQKSYAEAVGRNVTLSREQLAHMSALSKIAGEDAGRLVDEYDKVGIGIARATAYTGRLQERAKALGVSPAKATKMMADNIKLAASYSFRNGVNDIEKMSLRAASMRMDMNAIMSATEKFADIDKAISTSANIQMLGGSFAREFSNPMGAMYESMADPEAFQERILRTIRGKGSYNEKTGAVTFDPVTMRMMRELASNLGMTVDQITNPAMAEIQNQKVEEELRAKNNKEWDKAQLAAIKNLSRTNVDEETGEHFVTLLNDGKEEKVFLKDLTEEQLKIAQDSQMTEEGLWNDVADIKTILERTLGRARGTTSTKENITGLGAEWDAFTSQIQNGLMGTLSGWLNGNSFQPWDLFKNLSWPIGQMDVFTHGTEGFAEGGLVEPIPHAALGTVIQGSSTMGDKTPVLANAGEMILNPREQKGLFDLLRDIATTGLMAYGGNKLGRKFGMHGIGTNMALGNLLSGGNMGIGGMLGSGAGMLMQGRMMRGMQPMGMMPMGGFNRPITLMNPTVMMNGQTIMNGSIGDGTLVEELEDIADAATDATRATRSFSTRLMSLARRRTLMGSLTRGLLHIDRSRRRLGAKISNGRIGHYYRNKVADLKIRGMYASDWLSNTKMAKGARNFKTDVKSLFASPAVEQEMAVATTEEATMSAKQKRLSKRKKAKALKSLKDVKKSNAIAKASSNATKVVSETTNAVSKVGNAGKLLGKVGSVGKVLGKAAGPIGTALAIGGAISDMSAASSQYDAKVDEIEKSGMSDLEKARAKDRAAKEKNASYGGSAGMAIGATAGAVLGSAFGPLGTIAGGWLGSKAGEFIGKGIGGLFGGGEEDKLKEREEKMLANSVEGSAPVAKILTSIDKNVASILGRQVSMKALGLTPISPSIRALPDVSGFLKVSPNKEGENRQASNVPQKTDINLNVSGTIKLEGNGKSIDFDISKLLETPEFKRQLADIISKRVNEDANAGKTRKEYSSKNKFSD